MTIVQEDKIAVFIKTHMREELLQNCINSLQIYLNWPYRLYVADDSPNITIAKENLYDSLRMQGHFILVLQEYTPVTRARNMLLEFLEDEKYILRLDDDFEVSEETHIKNLVSILEHHPDIGAVSSIERQSGKGKGLKTGDINPWQGYLVKKHNKLFKIYKPLDDWRYRIIDDVRFAVCDFCRNFLLIKREVFDSVRWDERIFLEREHEDFMLSLREVGWRLAFTPDSVHLHQSDIIIQHKETYMYKRQIAEGFDYFLQKWKINEIREIYLAPNPSLHSSTI